MNTTNNTHPIIFFDGVCGLCNGFIDFVIKMDKHNTFRFSPLQSNFASQELPTEYILNLNSIVVLIDGQVHTKGEAVFIVLNKLGGTWKAISIVGKLPNKILNSGYDIVAENRYRLFGKKETCRLPTKEERELFVL